jgi:uncharacterized protein (TIGR00255 family)
MTAFGRCRKTIDNKDFTVEIKSVNNRFFDCSVRLPRAYSYLEEKIKPYLLERGISRGKVDVSINIERVGEPETHIVVDEGYAKEYIAALCDLRDKFGLHDDISVMRVAQNKDVFTTRREEEDVERDWEDFREALCEAVDVFIAGREREGANLANDIKQKVENIRENVKKIEALSDADVEGYRRKLEEKLRNMLSDNRIVFDENRILTECAIFADRVAIDEELVRLRSHFDGFYAILESDEPVGRKLDFLVQEINRETNTIGSKCSNSEIASIVVDIKCEIEKIREQIQNIE